MQCELKMDSDTIKRMEIENIFAPEKEDPQCLYVTFRHISSVSRIYEKTRCMRKESRILNYIPDEFEERYSEIRNIEYNLRQEEKCQTRVKMGLNDLVLSKKVRGTGKWQRVILPEGLSEVDLSRSKVKVVFSLSPPFW